MRHSELSNRGPASLLPQRRWKYQSPCTRRRMASSFPSIGKFWLPLMKVPENLDRTYAHSPATITSSMFIFTCGRKPSNPRSQASMASLPTTTDAFVAPIRWCIGKQFATIGGFRERHQDQDIQEGRDNHGSLLSHCDSYAYEIRLLSESCVKVADLGRVPGRTFMSCGLRSCRDNQRVPRRVRQ